MKQVRMTIEEVTRWDITVEVPNDANDADIESIIDEAISDGVGDAYESEIMYDTMKVLESVEVEEEETLSRDRFVGTEIFIDNVFGEVESLGEVEALYLHEKGKEFKGSLEELAEAMDYDIVEKREHQSMINTMLTIHDGDNELFSEYYYDTIADINQEYLDTFEYIQVCHDGLGNILFVK